MNQKERDEIEFQNNIIKDFMKGLKYKIKFPPGFNLYIGDHHTEFQIKVGLACGLTRDVLVKVIDRWTQDGDDGSKFLDRIEDDFFTLGPGYQKVLDFLKKQGELRIKQSIRGKASTVKQAKAKQGKKVKK